MLIKCKVFGSGTRPEKYSDLEPNGNVYWSTGTGAIVNIWAMTLLFRIHGYRDIHKFYKNKQKYAISLKKRYRIVGGTRQGLGLMGHRAGYRG